MPRLRPSAVLHNPTNGALLRRGTNTLTAVFTPADAFDYSSATNDVTLLVSPASISVASGIVADNKIYDRTTAATLSFNNVVLGGVVDGDAVALSTNGYAASFASAKPGHEIAVTVTGLTLTGTAATNYTFAQPNNLAADITLPRVQVAGGSPDIVISWPSNAAAFVLNQTASLVPPATWSPMTNAITVNGTNNTVIISAQAGPAYFELISLP